MTRLRPTLIFALALGIVACAAHDSDSVATGRAEVREVASALEPTPAGTSLSIALPHGPDPLLSDLTVPSDAPLRGMWSATQPWPLNGLHSVLLPNGRVLTYGTPTNASATQDGRYFDVWDPALGFGAGSHQTSFQAERVNSFCSTSAFLGDGRLLVSGGNSPVDSNEFTSADSNVGTAVSRLADDRWYGTMLTLADGRPLMLGGSAPYAALRAYQDPVAAINAGTVSMTPEVYEGAAGWRSLFGAHSRAAFGPDFHRYWYPRAWVVEGGEVFGISSEKMWFLDPAGDGAVTIAGDFKTGANAQTRPNIGPTSSAVLFAPGRILQVGGNGYYDGHGTPASALATIIDLGSGEPVLTEAPPMHHARHWPNTTVLPDGTVLVSGGTRFGNNGGADAVYPVEIYDPASGTWTEGASAAEIRVYHSAAILMPNGTVLSTGGGAPGPVNNLNAELYYPPYLFRDAGGIASLAERPIPTAINALEFAYGDLLELDVSSPLPIAKVVLIGTSAVTHSFNTQQRYRELVFSELDGRVSATLPESADRAPPGYYQVLVLDSAGVPSQGVIVGLGPDMAAPPLPTRLPRGGEVTLWAVSQPDHALAVDDAGLAVLKALGSAPDAAALASAQFTVRDGFSDSTCVSLESVQVPGRWLRHANHRLRLGQNDGSALFKNDATFCAEDGLAGGGITLRSKNFPGHVLRHRNFEIWLDPVAAGDAFALDATFLIERSPLPALPPIQAPPIPAGATASYSPEVASTPGALYSWDFGDGSAPTLFAPSPEAAHPFTEAGIYLVSLTLKVADGRTATKTFVQAVYAPAVPGAPQASSAVMLEPRGAGAARLWVVNPDNDSVSVFDTESQARLAEIAVGAGPRSVALSPDGRPWVVSRDASAIAIIDPSTLAAAQTIALPRAARPYGVVFAPNGSAAFVTLEAAGRVLELHPATGALLGSLSVGPNPRHLSISADSTRLLISRFITAPLPGEGTASVQTGAGAAEVVAVDRASFDVIQTIALRHGDAVDSSVSGRGIPNYLGAALISPDGQSAWVPSKQDNVARGALRDGHDLDFQNTVRAVTSRIDLAAGAEDHAARVDHDDSGLASAAAFHPTGAYLFVALETSREVAVLDPVGERELFRVEVGRAPQALAVSASGSQLYVHNFMDRTVSVVDLGPLVGFGEFRAPVTATLASVALEKLAATVLAGKQLFYDARDPRLARDGYLSCASCHEDGGQDGRVWDLTGFGEGLRNTIGLRGRAGGQGLLHWSANFDEVQDFEGQIRALAAGTGLLPDAVYFQGTRSQPLGDAKAGHSADLDALAAYVKSLSAVAPSPFRAASGKLTLLAAAGRLSFKRSGCVECHNGSTFSDEGARKLRDVGTLESSSGQRLYGPLTGIDAPSLREAWATAPYLHDGSAPSLASAILSHQGLPLTPSSLASLVAFVEQIDATEPGFLAAGTTYCAGENSTCAPPAGEAVTVYYGAKDRYFSRLAVTGPIACDNATFGDPVKGTRKTCRYR